MQQREVANQLCFISTYLSFDEEVSLKHQLNDQDASGKSMSNSFMFLLQISTIVALFNYISTTKGMLRPRNDNGMILSRNYASKLRYRRSGTGYSMKCLPKRMKICRIFKNGSLSSLSLPVFCAFCLPDVPVDFPRF